jgi:hypothetical protein
MNSYYQSPLEHGCHAVRTITEILVVPLHYLAIFDLHLLAYCMSAATLLAYLAATYGLHAARSASQGASSSAAATFESDVQTS